MKRYDLMHQINTRGTFLCSRKCIPHLKKADNPHILNNSPPLNMAQRWFRGHCAYTMAKYGMSMCALGMSGEFADEGIAVNTLWPATAIWTAAMKMLGGGEAARATCRSPRIMADAAYLILTSDAKSCTGNFFIDEELLRKHGVDDIDQYAEVPGTELMRDFFLD
jgi:citronellol/citronellal dehydrogenase